nr:integrase, catalytic region, zinc finger, CCHC-type, peptidase aspartic, catalytic [Tanacetum cinerariifolium]
MFVIHSDEALEIEKFKRARENKIEFAYDYGNLNASYVNKEINFSQQTISLKPYVPNVILEKIIIDLEDEVVSLLEKEKENLKTIKSLKSKGFESSENAFSESENQSENDCHVVKKECDKVENPKVIAPGLFKLNLDTSSSVRRPKHSGVIWKKKGSSNTSNFDLSSVNLLKLNKNVKMCDLFDDNNFFIFDDESVRISPVSKMPFRKKPHDSLNIVQIFLWNIDSGCSKHMMGNLALLTNFVEKFIGTVRFGNNDFAVIAGYGDVVIGLMTIKKVYYVEGLGQNLFSFGQFCGKVLEVAFRKSTCFVRNEDGVDLLTDDRSSNLYTIVLNEVASTSSTCLLAKASSSQSWLWHQHLEDLFQNFYDEYFDSSKIMKSSTTNVKTSNVEIPSNEEEVFHESSESFQEESSSSSLNDDVQQSSEEVGVPSLNTQSISNNMIPNVDDASTSHNMFNEHLEYAYFDASTSFHDSSNVHTFYQPYTYDKKWTKDHPLHKIISDPKSSVRTRGQIANSCLYSCLLSSIEPANVAKALRDADWVSAMQEELDQFSSLKVWRLVPRPEGKTIIKTK